MLETTDDALLAALQKDGRATVQHLAEAVGMSSSACWRRIKALEDAGIITRYAALVDRAKAGFAMSAILHVSLERHDSQYVGQFVAAIAGRAEVLECFSTTGDADYHLRVVVRDMESYNTFLETFMFKIPGIRNIRTNVIFKEIKNDVALPFRA